MILKEWRTSLQYSDFRVLSLASALHSVGFGMDNVVLGWLVFELTDSPVMVGLSAALRMVPLFLLGVFSGVLADSNDRRLHLWIVTFSGGLIMLCLGFILLVGLVNVWLVIGFTMLGGVTFAFLLTLRQAYTYDIVGPDNSLSGLSILQMATQIGGVFGAIFSGVLISEFGSGWLFIIIGGFYFGSALVLMKTKESGDSAPQLKPINNNLKESFKIYVNLLRDYPVLLYLMILASAIEIFGFSHMSLIPVFAKDVLGLGAVGLGVLTGIRQVGGVFGLMSLAVLGNITFKGYLMFGIMIAFGLTQMSLYISENLYVAAIGIFLINGCAMAVDVLIKTLMQLNVPNEHRGSAMGSWVFSIGTGPIGHVGIGSVASRFGSSIAFLVNGTILSSIGLLTMGFVPFIRRLK